MRTGASLVNCGLHLGLRQAHHRTCIEAGIDAAGGKQERACPPVRRGDSAEALASGRYGVVYHRQLPPRSTVAARWLWSWPPCLLDDFAAAGEQLGDDPRMPRHD